MSGTPRVESAPTSSTTSRARPDGLSTSLAKFLTCTGLPVRTIRLRSPVDGVSTTSRWRRSSATPCEATALYAAGFSRTYRTALPARVNSAAASTTARNVASRSSDDEMRNITRSSTSLCSAAGPIASVIGALSRSSVLNSSRHARHLSDSERTVTHCSDDA